MYRQCPDAGKTENDIIVGKFWLLSLNHVLHEQFRIIAWFARALALKNNFLMFSMLYRLESVKDWHFSFGIHLFKLYITLKTDQICIDVHCICVHLNYPFLIIGRIYSMYIQGIS